ncbi:hypothetical protein [Cyclobacterium amurskyense]|uniref:Uncharacterized protein n=1 Tax=Cyclobacterium amurskyense TaxID=320787 RepID=A0A0H4PWW1_9BACT|nr:hypothetical protein [Cyclobacterium amurskyense]AKP52857.1 hypothetical protein CA2015_3470 [Cyclobacterium amurskyense]
MNWKRISSIIFFIFCMSMFLISIKQRPTYARNPIFYSILVLGISANIIYEYYKNKKEEKDLLQIKNNKIKKSNKNYQPIIKAEDTPEDLLQFINIINVWGTNNKILREYLYEKSDNQDLISLKNFVDNNIVIINSHINNNENKKISRALKLTLKAYNELGLWTWEKKEI